jgi:hypothetical protein
MLQTGSAAICRGRDEMAVFSAGYSYSSLKECSDNGNVLFTLDN